MTRETRRSRRFLEWLDRRGLDDRPLIGTDDRRVSRIVVIPVLAESDLLFGTLRSLSENPTEELEETLVICVVNNRTQPHARPDQIDDNRKILAKLDGIVRGGGTLTRQKGQPASLRLAFIDASSSGQELGPKMGVGEARRIGLDHGLRVLCQNNFPDGLLISLDADSTVAPNYLEAIGRHFAASDSDAGVVAFAHPLPEDHKHREAMLLYELFLRYHELGLRVAGSPYALPTVGSTIVVRGTAYVAAGGMNRKEAGEDFYFIQQLVKTGWVSRIDTTTIFPSYRSSDRVPFGTGAAIGRFLGGDQAIRRVYHPQSYRLLGAWLDLVQNNLEADASDLLEDTTTIAPELGQFLIKKDFKNTWPRLQDNAPDLPGLVAQFHRWFDAFKSLKLIHHLRDNGLPSMPLEDAISDLFPSLEPKNGNANLSLRLQLLLDRLRETCSDLAAPGFPGRTPGSVARTYPVKQTTPIN
jgi:hypothetical protein